jgi:uncharacterized protein (TIGR00369 family)
MPTAHQPIHDSFARQALLTTLGATLTEVADGRVTITLPNAPHLAQQHGFAHAGALATIADSACGYACLTRMPAGSAVLSVEFKINLLAPAQGHHFTATGRVARAGRTLSVATAEVHAHPSHAGSDPEPKLIALMQATMMRVDPPNGAAG